MLPSVHAKSPRACKPDGGRIWAGRLERTYAHARARVRTRIARDSSIHSRARRRAGAHGHQLRASGRHVINNQMQAFLFMYIRTRTRTRTPISNAKNANTYSDNRTSAKHRKRCVHNIVLACLRTGKNASSPCNRCGACMDVCTHRVY